MNEYRTFTLEGVTYSIPEDHIDRANPPAERVYARIAPANTNFTLVLAETDNYSRNWQGSEAPLVTHINDHPGTGFEVFDFPSGKTVCQKDTPNNNCGLRIEDGPIGWSVLFNKDRIPNSESIRAEALEFIKIYREGSNADRG